MVSHIHRDVVILDHFGLPKMTMKRLFAFLLILSTSTLSAYPQGQTQGRIIGRVTDGMTKEPIIGANVVVEGTTLGASTDLEGRFEIRRLPLGTYAVRVSAIGYLATTVTDVVVGAARPAEISVAIIENEIRIEGVEVTAGYFRKISDTPLSTLAQTNEEIRRLPGGLEDVARAIAILPGVAQVDGGRNDLIVRGGAPSENLFVIDNIEVPNINHFGTQGSSGGPLSFINLDFVDNTSFSTGGFGVRYGDKLSSVLSISLREGRKDGVGGKATISASQFGLNLEGPFGGEVNTLFSARRSYLDFIFKAAGFGFVPEYWDFLNRTNIRLGSKDQVNILAIGALDNVRYFNDTENKRFENSRVMGSDQNQVIGGISWQHLFSEGYSTITVGQSYVDYDFRQSDSNLVRIFSNQSLEHESSVRGDVFLHVLKSTELLTGVQAKVVMFSADVFLRPFQTRFGDSLSVDAAFRTTGFKGSAYAQLSQVLGKSRMTVGGRVDYFDLIDKYTFSPRVSYTVALSPATNLNWSIGRYSQAPSYIWLAANAQNRSLEFIKVTQYVFGVDHTLRPDTRVSLEGYVKRYSDYPASLTRPYLVLANTGAGFGGSDDGYSSFGLDPLVSRGSGSAQGIELLVQKKLSEVPCYGTVSVSYNRAEFSAIDGIERPSSFDQRWIINVGGGYLFDDKWEFSAKFRYVTGRPYTPFDQFGYQNPALYNAARIGANHSLDIRVDRRWSFGAWTLVTYADIQNIYNRKAVTVPRFNERLGRSETNLASIGILPSIGVSAEF
jgi:hypothetical protein